MTLEEILTDFRIGSEAIGAGSVESSMPRRAEWRAADMAKAMKAIQALIDAAREEGRKEGIEEEREAQKLGL